MTALRALTQFGATAAIGPLHCGATIKEIAAPLEPPWDIGRVSKRRRWPHLFSHGDAEFCVCRFRRITAISVQTWRDAISLPVPGTTTLATFAGTLTHTQVTAELIAGGCHPSPVTLHRPPGQLALRVETTDVTFTFQAEAESMPLLAKVGHWINSDGHECTPPATDAPDDGFGA
ncbi:hypothetical protein AB0L71_11385 [Streptomyces sp. NPDC052052]|uniref:hypothetical protein n=1 Tax=Streptomyces sp. NPDC052052 TaxID=3154756 RepID=UPI00342F63F4